MSECILRRAICFDKAIKNTGRRYEKYRLAGIINPKYLSSNHGGHGEHSENKGLNLIYLITRWVIFKCDASP
jgi:hypothetical protein